MAPAFEVTTQFSKDLRSEAKEWKRGRNATEKWHWGSRLKAGVKPSMNMQEDDGLGPCEAAVSKTKVRPGKKPEKCSCCNPPAGTNHNIVKARTAWDMPQRRVVSTRNALDEMHDPDLTRSLIDELAPERGGTINASQRQPIRRRLTASDSTVQGVLYSYDLADTPATKASLEVFVRPDAKPSKATERLVAREYEVLDANGDVVRGRKARANLRKTESAGAEVVEEEDGFELV